MALYGPRTLPNGKRKITGLQRIILETDLYIMWIVRLALRRPYTFVVMAVLIAFMGVAAIVTMPVDIFPYIDIPIVSVLWQYTGLSPDEMEKRVVANFERGLTSNVNDIEHIESQSYNGI